MTPPSFWTDERIERLKRLWAAGLSCSQIAMELKAPSRNSVIGKVYRLELPRRTTVSKKTRSDKGLSRATGKRKLPWPQIAPTLTSEAPAPRMEATMEKPVCKPVTLLQLKAHHCRYPLWGPERREGLYCGGAAVEGLPYCLAHCRMAYRPAERREHRAA